jgi:hypothetical protein
VLAFDPARGAYAASAWAPVGAATADQAEGSPASPSVVLAAANEARAADLRDRLKQAGISVRRGEAASETAPKVRYFYDADRATAESIADLLPGGVAATRAPLAAEGASRLPLPGEIEVILGSE